jgi:hypothetical protein
MRLLLGTVRRMARRAHGGPLSETADCLLSAAVIAGWVLVFWLVSV